MDRSRLSFRQLFNMSFGFLSYRPDRGWALNLQLWIAEAHTPIRSVSALYVTLAERLGATLLSRDAQLAAAPGHDAAVEVI